MLDRFGEEDRRRVVRDIEKRYGIALYNIGNYRKYLRDGRGHRYLVLGGVGDWHGIDKKIFQSEERHPGDTLLFVAKLHPERMDIYSCAFAPLLQGRHKLTLTERGLYEFNLEPASGGLKIREIPSVVLNKVGEIVSKPSDQTRR